VTRAHSLNSIISPCWVWVLWARRRTGICSTRIRHPMIERLAAWNCHRFTPRVTAGGFEAGQLCYRRFWPPAPGQCASEDSASLQAAEPGGVRLWNSAHFHCIMACGDKLSNLVPIQPGRKAVSYNPEPIDTSKVTLSKELLALTEQLARSAHDVWARRRLADGWHHGPRRDDGRKEHPLLVSYEELPESEKEYDRDAALQTIKAILALGYQIEAPRPNVCPRASTIQARKFRCDYVGQTPLAKGFGTFPTYSVRRANA
jgi:RyR domain